MTDIDLFGLRELITRHRILLCFNGPISRSLIEEIGNALKNYLEADRAQPSAVMDVFGTYIEMTQNIRHYAVRQGYGEKESLATILVARDGEDGAYLVQAGNVVEAADAEALIARVKELAALDKTALKAAYKERLRRPREEGSHSGANLGLIDIARKSSRPLSAQLMSLPDGKALFSLLAVI
jgi:hypothetical protein